MSKYKCNIYIAIGWPPAHNTIITMHSSESQINPYSYMYMLVSVITCAKFSTHKLTGYWLKKALISLVYYFITIHDQCKHDDCLNNWNFALNTQHWVGLSLYTLIETTPWFMSLIKSILSLASVNDALNVWMAFVAVYNGMQRELHHWRSCVNPVSFQGAYDVLNHEVIILLWASWHRRLRREHSY